MTLTKSDAAHAAVELAREAAIAVAEPGTVGEHLGMSMEGERVATHRFRCDAAGYRGWAWSGAGRSVPRSRKVTVCETPPAAGRGRVALTGVGADLTPCAGRSRAGDVLPYTLDDPNLEPGFEATGDEETDQLAVWELGLGRVRVLSPQGRNDAAQRWYDGTHGPSAPSATQSEQPCGSCGHSFRWRVHCAPSSGVRQRMVLRHGAVVSLDHGCGAHSETDISWPQPVPCRCRWSTISPSTSRPNFGHALIPAGRPAPSR